MIDGLIIQLPSHINAEGLLPFIGLLSKANKESEISLDVGELQRVSPAATVALAAQANRWKAEGRRVSFVNLDKCPIRGYLQRMELLSVCGLETEDDFNRHDPRGRFVPVTKVALDVDRLGSDIAQCVAPGGEDFDHPMARIYDLVWYVITEVANNVRQHSKGTGYASAQVGLTEERVRIAIADNGMGVRQSFVEAGLPWSEELNDPGAIRKALEPRISSKGSPVNEGVGLTLTAELARQARAWLLILSGRGYAILSSEGALEIKLLADNSLYQGTLVAMTFEMKNVSDFAAMMDTAKRQAGLLQRKRGQGRFET